jgi:hypothetical protein
MQLSLFDRIEVLGLSVFCPRTVSEKPQIATEEKTQNTQIYWMFCMWPAVSDTIKYSHNPKVGG